MMVKTVCLVQIYKMKAWNDMLVVPDFCLDSVFIRSILCEPKDQNIILQITKI